MSNLTVQAPLEEPARQEYFMEMAKKQVAQLSRELGRPLTCCINTFGCQMNARDSEKLLGILEKIGYQETTDEHADFVLYNTCTVRENANLRVYGRLGYLNTMKKKNPHMMIALCGCMMQEPEVVEKIKKSYRFVDIIAEIKRLVADGVVEVMLLGQNVNSYGKNLEQPVTFAELLRQVNEIPGLERIRFMTSHPKDLSDDLIEAMRDCDKVCRHLHLPLQSGSSQILKVMNRHYTKEQYLELVEKIRKAVPDIALTTDIIVGFPGETEEDFEETMDVVRRVRYDSAFTFIYSKRTGTPAAKMENQVPEDVVKARFDRLLAEVQKISSEVCGRDVHTVQKVLVEELDDHVEGYVTGRMSNNTVVHFPGNADLIGKIVDVYLEESKGFYYMGKQA